MSPSKAEAAEAAGMVGAAALALYAGLQGPKCPFHRVVFVVSSGTLVSGGAWFAYQYYLRRCKGRGKGQGQGGGKGGAEGFRVVDLVRKNIRELEPYRCARDDYSEGILLDANENAFGPTLPHDLHDLQLERYPDPYQKELKEKIAAFRYLPRPGRVLLSPPHPAADSCVSGSHHHPTATTTHITSLTCPCTLHPPPPPRPTGVAGASRSSWGWAATRRST